MGRDLESLASEAAEAADVHEDVVQQPAEVSLLEPPVGPAARLGYTHAYPALTTATTAYLFVRRLGTWEFLAD